MHGVRLEDPDSDELAYLLIGERWMAWARGSPSGACEITVYHHDQQWQAVASTLDAAPSLTTPTLQQALQWNSGDMVMPALAPGRAWRVSSR
jgi:hypothetical protein